MFASSPTAAPSASVSGDVVQTPGGDAPPALGRLLADAARRHPGRAAFESRAPSMALSASQADAAVESLARRFGALGLAPGSLVGLRLPGGPDWALVFLAAERAGLTPCLLPLVGGLGPLARLVEGLRLEAVVTCATVGDLSPARELATVAAGYFGLRFPMALGPDLPDGIEPIDPLREPAAPDRRTIHPTPTELYVSVSPARPHGVIGTMATLLACASRFVEAARIEPGDRILQLVAPERLKGLATGLAAALLSDATVTWLAPFDAAALAVLLAEPCPSHLVVPAALESAMARCPLGPAIRSVTFLHEAPAAIKASGRFDRPVLDVLTVDETALLVARRDAGGRPSLAVAGTLRTGSDDRAEAYGDAVAIAEGGAVRPPFSRTEPQWHATRWSPEVFAGRLIAIVPWSRSDRPAET